MPMFWEENQTETTPYFCPQEIYNRIEDEIEQIKANWPVTERDAGGQIYNGFGKQKEPFVMLCVPGVLLPSNCNDFPRDGFQELMDCYGGVYDKCLFSDDTTCGQAHMFYDVAANTSKMLNAYEEHANGLIPGSVCEQNAYFGVGGGGLNGFHVTEAYEDTGFWVWRVRSTRFFELTEAHCDITINFWSRPDPLNPGSTIVELMSTTGDPADAVQNDNTPYCEDPIFLNPLP